MPLTSYTTADIVLTERRRLEQPLLLLIWVGTTAFSLAEGNVLYLISCTLGVGVNWVVVRRNMEIYVHRGIVNAGVLFALVVILLEAYLHNRMALITVGHFMMLIQLLKLFERKRARDYIQLLTLNMLLMITAALFCSALWFALVMVVYLLLSCYVAMVFTLKRGLDSAGAAALRGEPGPLSPRQVAWNVIRDWPGRALYRFIGKVMLPALVVGVLAFLLVPRTGNSMLDSVQKSLLSNDFETSIRLGKQKEIYLSDRIVLRVRAHREGAKSDKALPTSSRYLRGVVLNSYSHSCWKNNGGTERFLFSASELPPLDAELRSGAIRHDIRTMTLAQADLFTPYPTVQMTGPNQNAVMFSPALEYNLRGTYSPRRRIQYSTLSFPLPLTSRQRAHLQRIRGPENDQPPPQVQLPPLAKMQIRALAETWCGDLLQQRKQEPGRRDELNRDIAERLKSKLQSEYDYTLDLTDSDLDRDGVEDFLFYLRKGHCEYFASAMAVMCNLLDIQARVAAGFAMDEYDADADEYIVRERDAHAWCEVYTPSQGWDLYDPTPGGARIEAMDRSWFTFITDFFQEIRFQWYQKVVGYDFAEQRDLSDRATDQALTIWQSIWNGLLSLKNSFLNLLQHGVLDRILINFLLLLQGVTAAVVLAFVVRSIVRRRRRRRRPSVDRRLTLLTRLLNLLERRGLKRSPERTLREEMREAEEKFALPPHHVRPLTELQYRWRWGDQEPSATDLHQAREHFDALCEHLSTHASGYARKNGGWRIEREHR